jgi:hypothetical protein
VFCCLKVDIPYKIALSVDAGANIDDRGGPYLMASIRN